MCFDCVLCLVCCVVNVPSGRSLGALVLFLLLILTLRLIDIDIDIAYCNSIDIVFYLFLILNLKNKKQEDQHPGPNIEGLGSPARLGEEVTSYHPSHFGCMHLTSVILVVSSYVHCEIRNWGFGVRFVCA